MVYHNKKIEPCKMWDGWYVEVDGEPLAYEVNLSDEDTYGTGMFPGDYPCFHTFDTEKEAVRAGKIYSRWPDLIDEVL
jgi:hypothetical protein